MNVEWVFYLLLAIANCITAILIFFSALYIQTFNLPTWYKIALIITAFGFAAQGALSIPYLMYGETIYTGALPLWVFNDIGIALIAIHYVWNFIIKNRYDNSN